MPDDKRLDRIEDKVDAIADKLGDTNVILAAQHESLKAHMRRSDHLEKIVLPLQRRANMVDGVLRAIGVLAAIAALIEAIRMSG